MIKPMTKAEYQALNKLSDEELDYIIDESWNWHNSAGEIQTERYIDETKWMYDYSAGEPGFIRQSKGGLLSNADGIRIVTNELPVKIKQYFRTKFSKKIGVREVKEKWRNILEAAIYDIKQLDYIPKDELHIIIYKFHLKAQYADPDNFATVLITDILRDTYLLKDDTYHDVIQVTCGIYDDKHQGTEIIILPITELINHPKLFTDMTMGKQMYNDAALYNGIIDSP